MLDKQPTTAVEHRARQVCDAGTAARLAALVDVVAAASARDLTPAPAVDGTPVIVATEGDRYHRVAPARPTQAACGAVTGGRRLARETATALSLDPCHHPPCFGCKS